MNQIQWKEKRSELDQSVNFTTYTSPGMIECRFVRRREDYFIIYLSSQTACNQACRMCHLTATKQTRYLNIHADGFVKQAKRVFEYYDGFQPHTAKQVHFNFMARGEPLDNPYFLAENQRVLCKLGKMARNRGLFPRFLISTIIPKSLETPLDEVFPVIHPDLYYSIYSLEDAFRKRWLPKAKDGYDALRELKRWQQLTKKIPKLHYAFIEGENDSESQVRRIGTICRDLGLRVDFNVVRYNPADDSSKETPEDVVYRLVEVFREELPEAKVKIVPRVGFDVKASCGMFVS